MNNETKNVQERNELHKTIWDIANDLRGHVDGWEFKNYVLGFLFYRYISEYITKYINDREHEQGSSNDFDYTKIEDSQITQEIIEEVARTKGFFIKPSELFINVAKNAYMDEENLNIKLSNAFKNIQDSTSNRSSEDNFQGLFSDINVNSESLGTTVRNRNKKLADIITKIANMKLGSLQGNSIDAFGDAYEYLMSMYASNAGKSGGEFFTPQEVSELLTKLAIVGKDEINDIYDPACGSGSLLLQAKKIFPKNKIRGGFYGQEINITTYNLCRINMFLHDVGFEKFHIYRDDTLLQPGFMEKTGPDKGFDVIVSNPPYSIKWEGSDNQLLINDERFAPAGILAPKSKADFAFIMHTVHYLSSTGSAAIVCFPGIMYRGGAEQKIRKYLIDYNFVDAIIQLPDSLFYGTTIATTIMILKKNKDPNDVVFIDASNQFIKVNNGNKLLPEHIENIVRTYSERKDIENFAKVVPNQQIRDNSYNLSVSSYVQKPDNKEVIDIKQLNQKIADTVKKVHYLRESIDEIVKDLEGII